MAPCERRSGGANRADFVRLLARTVLELPRALAEVAQRLVDLGFIVLWRAARRVALGVVAISEAAVPGSVPVIRYG